MLIVQGVESLYKCVVQLFSQFIIEYPPLKDCVVISSSFNVCSASFLDLISFALSTFKKWKTLSCTR